MSTRPFELRKDGILVHRFHDVDDGPSAQRQASDMAMKFYGDAPDEVQQTVTVVPSGDFELDSSEGFCGSFPSQEEAEAAIPRFRALLEMRRAAPSVVPARFRRAPVELTFAVRRLED